MNLGKISLALVFTVCVFVCAQGQVKRKPVPKPSPKPLITLGAMTDDGKRVVLKSDGTWEYDTKQTAPIAVAPSAHTVDFQAAAIFKSGEVVPIPRTTFYLLSRSLEETIATAEMRNLIIAEAQRGDADMSKMLVDMANRLNLRGFIRYAFGSTQISKDYAAAAQSAFAGITKYDTTTDFQGNGSFKNVPPGKYHLFGYTEIRKNFISWHSEVEVKDADQKLVLDTNNSLP